LSAGRTIELLCALRLELHFRGCDGIVESAAQQIEEQSTDPAVAVTEGVYLFELRVELERGQDVLSSQQVRELALDILPADHVAVAEADRSRADSVLVDLRLDQPAQFEDVIHGERATLVTDSASPFVGRNHPGDGEFTTNLPETFLG